MDIVIQNGRVIDPAAGINEICSVGIEGAKIVDISAGHLDGKYTINADGCIVTPGLIDFHTHLFEGGSLYGIHPDCLLSQGVTAAVDAGTSGSAGFEAFYRSIIQNSILTVKAFISLGATGRLVILNAKEQIPRRMTGTRSIAFIFLPSTELKHNRNGVKWCGSTDT